MKSSLSIFSLIIFSLTLLFVVMDQFSGPITYGLLVGGSILGFIFAIFGQRGTIRNYGLLGNFIVILVVIIIPAIVTNFEIPRIFTDLLF